MEKFVEFQPYIIKLSSFIVFELFINFSVIFGCAKMRQPLIRTFIIYRITFSVLPNLTARIIYLPVIILAVIAYDRMKAITKGWNT